MPSETPILQYLRLTLLPCIGRLLGKRRRISSLYLFFTLGICALLLSCLCLTFGQNLSSLDELRQEFEKFITLHGVTSSNQPFRESVRSVLTYAEAEIYVSHICFMTLWLITSLAAVFRVFSESVATEKYVYALYIIYGADTRLMRKNIIREFWVLGLPALAISVPMGIALCNDKGEVAAFTLVCALEMLSSFFLLSLLCAHRVTARLFRESCIQLMTAIDTSEYIESPRRISLRRTLRRKNGFSYALTAFSRMRTYRFTQALSIALIGAVLFSMTALTLPDNYAIEDSTPEYALTFTEGISREDLSENYLPAIESLEAVISTSTKASDTAERLGTHLLLKPRQVQDTNDPSLLQQDDKWALDTIKIACGDDATQTELGELNAVIPDKFKDRLLSPLGYSLAVLPARTAAYVYPVQNGKPAIEIGDTVEIAIPDGTPGYDRYGNHITVTVTRMVAVGEVTTIQTLDHPIVEKVCPRIFEDYLFLNPEDYAAVTGTVQTRSVAVGEAFAEDLGLTDGACHLLLPKKLKDTYAGLSHITLIAFDKAAIKPFSSQEKTANGTVQKLPTDQFFINETYRYAGIYLGSPEDYLSSPTAEKAMLDHISEYAEKHQDVSLHTTVYPVSDITFVSDLSFPCAIFNSHDAVSFASVTTDLATFPMMQAIGGDKALYIMDCNAAVLSISSDTSLAIGDLMYLTTKVPKAFTDAMAQSKIPLVCAKEDYGLTAGYVRGLFSAKHSDVSLALVQFDSSSNLVQDHYPYEIIGTGSYVPVGNTRSNSIMTLSELDSMLVFQGDPKEERVHASVLQGDLATNDFSVMTEQEANLKEKLLTGQAVLYLPEAHPLSLAPGDLIHIALAEPLALDLIQISLSGRDLLMMQMEKLDHLYLPLTLISVEADSTLTTPTLVITEDDFCQVSSRAGIYANLTIHIDSYATLEELSEISDVLHGMAGKNVILDNRGAVLRSRGTGSQRYPSILRKMILPLCLLLFLLPLSAARTLHLRREKERSAYIAAGEHRAMKLRMMLGEGILSCILNGGLYVLLCPLMILCLKLFCGKFHVPLMPESFSVVTFSGILGLILLSSVISSLLAALHPLKLRKHPSSTKGDTAL